MFEGKALPIDFKLAKYLRDQAKETLEEMNMSPDGICTNGVKAQLQIWQDMATFLCPDHVWKDGANGGSQPIRICETCGGKENEAFLDNWLKETYTRDCHNCSSCGADINNILLSMNPDRETAMLPGYAACYAEAHSNPDEETKRKIDAIISGKENCSHWTGRKINI
jgi:hypothetical protein